MGNKVSIIAVWLWKIFMLTDMGVFRVGHTHRPYTLKVYLVSACGGALVMNAFQFMHIKGGYGSILELACVSFRLKRYVFLKKCPSSDLPRPVRQGG